MFPFDPPENIRKPSGSDEFFKISLQKSCDEILMIFFGIRV